MAKGKGGRKPKVDEDLILVQEFSKGCLASFETIVNRYETKVHNLAMRLTRNTEDAEEVLQDVFMTVYRKIDGFQGKAKFSSWLYRITVNAAFMKLRKRKQNKTVSLDDLLPNIKDKTIFDHSNVSERGDSRAINNEIRESLEDAIAKLPDEYRAVFVLRDIDGLSNKEVGEILGLSIPAVKSRLHRSRLMLRKKLKRFYDDYTDDSKIFSASHKRIQRAA